MKRAKEETGADYCVVILGSDFAQRGTLSFFPRHIRARMAVDAGADLVFALPVLAGSAAAPDFAKGAVGILEGLGCIDFLSFGSESGNVSELSGIADKQAAAKKNVFNSLKSGHTYAKALGGALDNLCKPNDILGVEYIQALKTFSKITPHTIAREGDHNGIEGGGFYSAGKIREMMGKGAVESLFAHLPDSSMAITRQALSFKEYLLPDDISMVLSYALWVRINRNDDLTDISGINAALANRIKAKYNEFTDFSQFCALVKAKNFTYASIARALVRLTLGIRMSDMEDFKECNCAPFARILGFRREADPLLSNIKNHSNIPIVSKAADYKKTLDEKSQALFMQDIHAADLYQKIINTKVHMNSKVSDLKREIYTM